LGYRKLCKESGGEKGLGKQVGRVKQENRSKKGERGQGRGKGGNQQGREVSKKEGKIRGEGEVTCTIQTMWMGRTHTA